MTLELSRNCDYALLAPTSMGVRLTPADGQPWHCKSPLSLQVTSAESNVASVSSFLGLPVKILTTLVKDSPVARLIQDDLAGRHMDVEASEVDQAGPWGYRHQFNLADSGYGARGPRVYNDRSGEVGRTLNHNDFDLEKIFGEEGVQVVHISGLVAALSSQTGEFCRKTAEVAKKHGTRICFDLNYRASFWENREQELREIFLEIANIADILVGNEEDFQLCLGLEGPEAGGKDISSKIDNFKEMISKAKAEFPNATVFANTLREVVDTNCHRWGAIMHENGNWHVIEPREITVLDRIGGGDGFVGGLLYGILRGWEPEKWAQFGWAAGALVVSFMTDYAQPLDEDQIWSIWEGNARVKR